MSLKAWLRKVLDIKPEVITRTTFVYPISKENQEFDRIVNNFNNWFYFSTKSSYSLSDYESDIYKCATDLLGPSKAQVIVDAIKVNWGITQFFTHDVAEGKVVLDYIKSDPKMLKYFYSYHRIGEKNRHVLSEKQFKAMESLEKELVDIKLVQFEFAEDVETLLEFVKGFTTSKIEDEKTED